MQENFDTLRQVTEMLGLRGRENPMCSRILTTLPASVVLSVIALLPVNAIVVVIGLRVAE